MVATASTRNDPFDLVGTTIAGKYRVDRVIGHGGFGVVYGGFHTYVDQPIAIKCMRPYGLTPEDDAIEAELFLREARVLFTLSHPAIVRLYDMGSFAAAKRQLPYVVLELLPGLTLEQEIALRTDTKRHFGARELLSIFEPVLEAVSYAHENGVVHRDLKPSNVMLIEQGGALRAKVVDFGIARVTSEARRTATSTVFTPLYAAPEQWDPRRGPTDALSDVFALALLLAEAAMLKPVLEPSSTPVQLYEQSMSIDGRELQATRRDLGVKFLRAVERGSKASRMERTQSVRELLDEVRDALTSAEPDSASGSRIARPAASPLTGSGTFARAPTPLPTAVDIPLEAYAPPPPPSAPGSSSRLEAARRSSTPPTRAEGFAATVFARPPGAEQAPSVEQPPRDVRRSSRQATTGGPRVMASDQNRVFAMWGPVFVVVWKGIVHVEAAREIQFALRDFARRTPGQKVTLLTVVEQKAPMPDGDARTALANILRFCSEEVACSAVAMEGDGFRNAAARSVATGLSLLARQPFPHRVFSSVPDSANWIAQTLAKTTSRFSSEALVEAVATIRARAR